MTKKLIGISCALLTVAIVLTMAGPSSADENWQVTVTPYVWLPNVNARLEISTPNVPEAGGKVITCLPQCIFDVQVGPNNYLEHLNFAAMLAADVRYKRWDLATDAINTNLTVNTGTVSSITGPFGRIVIPFHVNTSSRFTGTIWTIDGGYMFIRDKMFNSDFLVGYRTVSLSANVGYDFGGPFGKFARSGTVRGSGGPSDGLIGLKGRLNLSSKLFIPYYADIGSGSDVSTAQEYVGIGYGHNASAELLYRNLMFTSTNSPLKIVRFSGPALGYTFRF